MLDRNSPGRTTEMRYPTRGSETVHRRPTPRLRPRRPVNIASRRAWRANLCPKKLETVIREASDAHLRPRRAGTDNAAARAATAATINSKDRTTPAPSRRGPSRCDCLRQSQFSDPQRKNQNGDNLLIVLLRTPDGSLQQDRTSSPQLGAPSPANVLNVADFCLISRRRGFIHRHLME